MIENEIAKEIVDETYHIDKKLGLLINLGNALAIAVQA